MNTTTMFVPNYAISGSTMPSKIRRVLLLGDPGDGKTFSALTFPNPLVIDFDNQLAKFVGTVSFHSLPFHNSDFVEKTFGTKIKPIALLKFLREDAKKLNENQTIIIDSLSVLNDAVQKHYWETCPMAKIDKTEKDAFAYWDNILDYYIELHNNLVMSPCNVVVCAHLKPIYHKTAGTVIGYKPLLDGSFSSRIGNYYTDVMRCVVKSKVNATPDNKSLSVNYLWQIHGDEFVSCKSSRKDKSVMYVPANYSELFK